MAILRGEGAFKNVDVVVSWLEDPSAKEPAKRVMVEGYLHPDSPAAAGQINPNLTTTRYEKKDGTPAISNLAPMASKQIDTILAGAGSKVSREETESGKIRVTAGVQANLMKASKGTNGLIINTAEPIKPTELSMFNVRDKKFEGIAKAKAAQELAESKAAPETQVEAPEAETQVEEPTAEDFEASV